MAWVGARRECRFRREDGVVVVGASGALARITAAADRGVERVSVAISGRGYRESVKVGLGRRMGMMQRLVV